MVCLPQRKNSVRSNLRQPLTTPEQAPPIQIYVAVNGQQVGPLDLAGFAGHLGTPEAAAATYVWMPGMAEWALASTVAALQPAIAAMGQSGGDEFSAPSDPAAYMLGVWISDNFDWTIKEKTFDAIVQMKLLPDGRFEGATLFRSKEKLDGPITISHEKGTWSVVPADDGQFGFERKILYTNVMDNEVVDKGQVVDNFIFKATGPNLVTSTEKIDFVRIPEGE